MDKLKMYILVKDDIPLGMAMTAVAHSSLATYLEFKDHIDTINWLQGPFFKVVCKVNDREFQKAKELGDHVVLTESQLENQEVVIGFRPRTEYPKSFKYFRLYR